MLEVCDFWGKKIGMFGSVKKCMISTGLSDFDIYKALETGNCVKGFCVNFSDSYLRSCCINSLVKYHGSFNGEQIADLLGISKSNVHLIIRNSLQKLKEGLLNENI